MMLDRDKLRADTLAVLTANTSGWGLRRQSVAGAVRAVGHLCNDAHVGNALQWLKRKGKAENRVHDRWYAVPHSEAHDGAPRRPPG